MKYKIGDVKRILGIPAETLRFFEKKGLVVPQKNEHNNYRYYDTLDLNKLVAYKLYRSMEFSMDASLEILNTSSHVDSMAMIDGQIGEVQKKIRYYEAVLYRMRELQHSLQQIEKMKNKFCIKDSPEVLIYYNQVNDAFETDVKRRKITRKWLECLPLVWMALHIPVNEIPWGSIVNWGYAVPTRYREVAKRLDSPLIKKIPSQRSVYTVLECREGEMLTPYSLQPALDYMDQNGLVLNGDVIGWIIDEEKGGKGDVRYFEVWLPAADKC